MIALAISTLLMACSIRIAGLSHGLTILAKPWKRKRPTNRIPSRQAVTKRWHDWRSVYRATSDERAAAIGGISDDQHSIPRDSARFRLSGLGRQTRGLVPVHLDRARNDGMPVGGHPQSLLCRDDGTIHSLRGLFPNSLPQPLIRQNVSI